MPTPPLLNYTLSPRKGYLNTKKVYLLFYKKFNKSVTFVVVYDDDILITGNDEFEMTSLKEYID